MLTNSDWILTNVQSIETHTGKHSSNIEAECLFFLSKIITGRETESL